MKWILHTEKSQYLPEELTYEIINGIMFQLHSVQF